MKALVLYFNVLQNGMPSRMMAREGQIKILSL